jgi:hypothetical protein
VPAPPTVAAAGGRAALQRDSSCGAVLHASPFTTATAGLRPRIAANVASAARRLAIPCVLFAERAAAGPRHCRAEAEGVSNNAVSEPPRATLTVPSCGLAEPKPRPLPQSPTADRWHRIAAHAASAAEGADAARALR